MITLELKNYITDGPGFAGTLYYNISENEIVNVNDGVYHKFENPILAIINTANVTKSDFEKYVNKYQDDLVYELDYRQFKTRSVALQFEDGTTGLFLVGGVDCIVNIINFDLDTIKTIEFTTNNN